MKLLFIRLNKTQAELATKLDVSVVHINKLLNGAVAPSFAMAFRLAKELGSTVTELWDYTTELGIVARTDHTNRRR